jgi:hypothetical protein
VRKINATDRSSKLRHLPRSAAATQGHAELGAESQLEMHCSFAELGTNLASARDCHEGSRVGKAGATTSLLVD